MANYKLNQTGEQIQNALNLIDSNTATSGQVLTADGNGGASWQDASGGGGGIQLYLHQMSLNNQAFITISKDPGKYDGNAISVIIHDSIKATYNDCIILNYYNATEPMTIKFDYVSNGTINSITVNEFTSITDTVTPL